MEACGAAWCTQAAAQQHTHSFMSLLAWPLLRMRYSVSSSGTWGAAATRVLRAACSAWVHGGADQARPPASSRLQQHGQHTSMGCSSSWASSSCVPGGSAAIAEGLPPPRGAGWLLQSTTRPAGPTSSLAAAWAGRGRIALATRPLFARGTSALHCHKLHCHRGTAACRCRGSPPVATAMVRTTRFGPHRPPPAASRHSAAWRLVMRGPLRADAVQALSLHASSCLHARHAQPRVPLPPLHAQTPPGGSPAWTGPAMRP